MNSIVSYVSGLQQNDGSFAGDQWGEIDTRFSFCAVACLALLVSFTNYSYIILVEKILIIKIDLLI